MAASESSRALGAVNASDFELDLLAVAETGIGVRTRPDIGGVEILITAGGRLRDVVVLHPVQALEVARRLLGAAASIGAGDRL